MTSTALFVTCLVDQLFPRMGEAAVQLLEEAGCSVAFPEAQTCCGQPAFNAGYRDAALPLARRFVEIFEPYDAVVSVSGSCASMTRVFSPGLFADDPAWSLRSRALAKRTFELTEYLDSRGFQPRARFVGRVAYHPSCHLLRELGVDRAPRELLSRVEGLELVDLQDGAACCGFGGAFSVKFPELSSAILDDKLRAVEASGAVMLTAADAGCLMQIGGGLARNGSRVRTAHVAELLAGLA
ncbi:MAG: (Fe-S)-binding protein [Myxococcota bacterium]